MITFFVALVAPPYLFAFGYLGAASKRARKSGVKLRDVMHGQTLAHLYTPTSTDTVVQCLRLQYGAHIVHTKPFTYARAHTVATEGDDLGS